MILQNILIAIFAIINLKSINAHEAKDFDDSILYKIEFEVPPDLQSEDFNIKHHIPSFYTHDNEEYKCAIPIAEETREEKTLEYTGLSPLQLIRPMFSSISCSYRIEAYWSYEICHGFHIKQYHEEREGKNVKLQEYFLGRWSDEKQDKLTLKLAQDRKDGIQFKTTKIDNVNYPYLELEMSNGTLCDLNNEPRTTKIRYVCYPHGKNAIYSFKETSSCNYEAIILTSTLCMHPAFLPEESKEIPISCYLSQTFSRKPLSLLKQSLEDLQMTDLSSKIDIVANNRQFSVDSINVADLQKVLEDMAPIPFESIAGSPPAPWGEDNDLTPTVKLDASNYVTGRGDYKALYDFLFGNCLTGGTGWWKYEFCFGRYVRQFHKDKKSETEVILGYFKDDLHRDWLKSHPAKRMRRNPNEPDTTLWHHYGAGSRCDKTGNLRETDVKLMCVASSSMSSVSMYLLEPKTCQYILVVESPMVCPLIPMVDEDGLISKPGFQKFLDVMMTKLKDEEDGEESEAENDEKKTEESEGYISVLTEDTPPEEGTNAIFGV
ncbi:endoplasmic reticulum lectin 1 [Episyrphus balteatus]|uniref:endoplasmic reticulum lectin 1 n=1 Tax=Episyrphus balteatus TaxID=286459 RepID=UPI0024869388|nr:endoplasmic reticulum lectin 1 [Episyrphus balteatus]